MIGEAKGFFLVVGPLIVLLVPDCGRVSLKSTEICSQKSNKDNEWRPQPINYTDRHCLDAVS